MILLWYSFKAWLWKRRRRVASMRLASKSVVMSKPGATLCNCAGYGCYECGWSGWR